MGESRVTCASIREKILWFKIDTNWCRNLYRLCERFCKGTSEVSLCGRDVYSYDVKLYNLAFTLRIHSKNIIVVTVVMIGYDCVCSINTYLNFQFLNRICAFNSRFFPNCKQNQRYFTFFFIFNPKFNILAQVVCTSIHTIFPLNIFIKNMRVNKSKNE